jgi:hypothetical protein
MCIILLVMCRICIMLSVWPITCPLWSTSCANVEILLLFWKDSRSSLNVLGNCTGLCAIYLYPQSGHFSWQTPLCSNLFVYCVVVYLCCESSLWFSLLCLLVLNWICWRLNYMTGLNANSGEYSIFPTGFFCWNLFLVLVFVHSIIYVTW